ncbi:aminopeptidase N [Solenopsis invicta]|uniref:aminopeptidase N n=1 Tax=Solenopsis invicta TaxID=13686 RepID=UPI00193CD716|nr:aminopeptidase N [Solenopsis invicta]
MNVFKIKEKDFVILTFSENLEIGENAKLHLTYNGKLNDETHGFFKSSYQDKEGKTTWFAATHFEPVSARQAFPCWDEPQFKAKFTITINVPDKKYKAISNTLVNEKENATTFEQTPLMSSYLVAFAVSDFQGLSNEGKNFSIWAKPTVEDSEKEFALKYGETTLEELKDFTNIDYYRMINKMDQIAIPGFSGAMENWGLVTYRESGLLNVKGKTTTKAKQEIATVIAHELSHQWFGNLVTCKWWNDIWLNEGFATFFQYYITDKVISKMNEKESWRLMEQFVIKNVQETSFVVDASSKTHALNPKTSIQSPSQIRSLFDDISYKKGAAILNMLYEFFGEDLFKSGLRQYLDEYSYKPVTSGNLFDAIGKQKEVKEDYLPKNVTLEDIMKNWINEPGYPVVTINREEDGKITAEQERFFLVQPAKKDETQWYIPLNYVIQDDYDKVLPKDKKSGWLAPTKEKKDKKNKKSFDEEIENTKWILFNKDQTGYYRVNYDNANWKLLSEFLENNPGNSNISATNRAQLIDDALNLARAGYLKDYAIALDITKYLNTEIDYIPWYAAVRAFDYLDSVLQGGQQHEVYKKYVAAKIQGLVNKVNYKDWENGTHVDKLAKVLALKTACKYGWQDCTEFATETLTQWLKKDQDNDKKTNTQKNKKKDKNPFLSDFWIDIRSEILCAGLREATAETWNNALNKYESVTDNDEKKDILAGLGCVTAKETIELFLNKSIGKDSIDVFATMNSIAAGNAKSFDILINFIKNHLEDIQKADKEDNSLLIALFNNLANKVDTIEQYGELSKLIYGQLQNTQKVELAAAIHKIEWIKSHRTDVEKWMVEHQPETQQPNEPDSASSITLTSFLLFITLLITRCTMLTMRFLLPLMLAIVACWASIYPFENELPQALEEISDNYRLPTNVVPTAYNIELTPTFESDNKTAKFTFQGKSIITLDIKERTNTIMFHARGLEFNKEDIKLKYSVSQSAIKMYTAIKVLKIKEKDFVMLSFMNNLDIVNNAELYLQYTGKLNDETRGFFKSSYQDKEGKTTWFAATHFEPVSARQAFPCWDEPQFKAKFTITINVPDKNYKAISNMPGKVTEKKTIFEQTPSMSPYLVAFAVSDFTNLTNKDKNFSVWAKPTVRQSEKRFAFYYGWKVLEELKDFTNIDYYGTMKKMDQIAIPGFSGAMENWGLVTYRESGLFNVNGKTTTEAKQEIATVIAHEFSHQWFGNLVTCEWWNEIWLNEGFATFFQYYITDKIISKMYDKESWRLMEQFVIKNVQETSFVVDASSKTHALNPKTSIQSPSQIRSLFDDISYKKGAAILNMLYGFFGEDIFKAGLRQYLNKYSYKTVNSDQLFSAIVIEPENLPEFIQFADVMKTWINKPGYPVVIVKRDKDGVINVNQERFFLIKPAKRDDTQWYIPLNYVTQDDPQVVMPKIKRFRWMPPRTTMILRNVNNTKWILFNKDQTGYYRVNYDDANWKLLSEFLEKNPDNSSISATNRAQLIDDALNLARAGYLNYTTALEITKYLYTETDYIPWYAAVRAFDYLDGVLQGGQQHETYKKYVASKLKGLVTKVNYTDWKNCGHVDKLAKVLALKTACKYGLEDCTEFATKTLTQWLEKDQDNDKTQEDKKEDKNPFLSSDFWIDIRSGILCAGLREASAETWNKTLTKYKSVTDNDEKRDILAGLGCTTANEIIQRFLDLSIEKDPVIDVFATMNSIAAGNAKSFEILINFINNNIEKIQKADNEDNSLLIAFFNNLANKVDTIEQYAELSLLVHRQIQTTQKVEGLADAIYKIEWIKNYRADVEKWLLDNAGSKEENSRKPDSATSITLTSFLLIITLLITQF